MGLHGNSASRGLPFMEFSRWIYEVSQTMTSPFLRSWAHLVCGSVLAAWLVGSAMSAQETPRYDYGAARPLEIDRGASVLWQDLQKLKTRASLILVVAHPDDAVSILKPGDAVLNWPNHITESDFQDGLRSGDMAFRSPGTRSLML